MENEQQPVGEPQAPEPVQVVQQSPIAQEQSTQEEPTGEPGKFRSYWIRFKRFINECKRVMKVIQRPSKEEFLTTAKVSAAGIAILGLLGFILSMIQQLVI
ncbi:MAG TPA: protein translocase SEC61 complex subunit gamma [Candidatus Nanoarchaeia archaeon]|nr:protein translocase SEC61 complex subunit gamma [Candidatus Nanoarchaeia archaeon]